MKKLLFAAALAVACLAVPASAQHVIDPSVIQPGAAEAVLTSAPMPAPGAEFQGPSAGTDVVLVQPDQVNSVAETLPAMIAAAIFAVLLRLVGPFAFVLKVARADQLIEKYAKGIIDEWLDDHPEWRQKGISVDVKKAWIANIAQQVVTIAPAWLIKFLGGKEAIMQKVRNRMPDILKDAFPAVFAAANLPGAAPPPRPTAPSTT